uniref:B30.2/SPRY domain-containing protein n=1 Tax=Ditylenchus dipsaci TaxID=166011 RepID=A0A915DS63_9BILA
MLSNSEVNMREIQLKLYSSTQLAEDQMPMYLEDLTPDNCKNLELTASQLVVSYKSNAKHKPVSIRSNTPIPKGLDFYYFEMTVSKSGKNRKLVIGLSEQEFGLGNNLPGFDEWSVGYHGHTGYKHAICRDGAQYGPTFGSKDIIGCGLNFKAKTIFFTKNGVYLGDAFERAQTEVALFPTIGMASNKSEIMLNFGQNKFCFAIDQHREKLKSENALSSTIPLAHPPLCRMPTPNLIGHKRPAGNSPTPEKRRRSPVQQYSPANPTGSASLMASQTSSSNSSELVVFVERFDESVLDNHPNSIDHAPDDYPTTSQETGLSRYNNLLKKP